MKQSTDNLALLAMPGTEKFSANIDFYLKQWKCTDKSFILPTTLTRFNSGDAKAVLNESVRGKDIYIISDPYNYSVTYEMRGITNHMSPDDHFQDIIRTLSAIDGKTNSISVLMTSLYSARQDGRLMRESLDCAVALQTLERCGVNNFIIFDAHNPKIQNAVPLTSFDNLYPDYQMIKAMTKAVDDLQLDQDHTIIVSPDAGGVQRCLRLAESLSLNIGMFYKQRDTSKVVNGLNKIQRHEYIGSDIAGKDVIIIDDILATGGSLVDSFYKLKELGARRIFSFITFGMFTNGYEIFDRAYSEGVFDKIFITNLTYHQVQNGKERPYIHNVDVSKYAAYIIDCIHDGTSVSEVIDPYNKIKALLEQIKV